MDSRKEREIQRKANPQRDSLEREPTPPPRGRKLREKMRRGIDKSRGEKKEREGKGKVNEERPRTGRGGREGRG